jgi:type I restriction enzyme S subunit
MTKKLLPNVPPIRFPEFQGEWTERKASKYFASSRKRGTEGLPICSVTQNDGLVRRDSLDRQIGVDAGFEQNLRAEKNDLVYNMMRMWQGAVGKATESCMVSPAYVVLSPRKAANSQFFLYMFNRKRALYWLWAFSYGLTNDRLRLYYKDFAQIPFFAPEIDEQDKIAAFLEVVDEKITQLQKKRELLKEYKKGVMQQIFTQQIRFKDESGNDFPDWKEAEFEQRVERVATKYTPQPNDLTPSIELESIEPDTGRLIRVFNAGDQASTKGQFLAGDVLFGKLRPYLRKYAIPDFDGVCSSEIWILRGRKGVNNGFLYYLLQSERFSSVTHKTAGSKMPRAEWQFVGTAPFAFPIAEEQTKIYEFLRSIDSKIVTVDAACRAMKMFKDGLLQSMFV